MVIYTGNKKYNCAESIFDLFGEHKQLAKDIFLQPYKLINLQNITEEELQHQIWFALMVKVFKNISFAPEIIIKKIRTNLTIIDSHGGVDLICAVVKYLLETKDVKDKENFFAEITSNLSEETGGKIMTLANRLRNEGKELGMQQGMQHGMKQGLQLGEEKALKTVAINLLASNMPANKVAEFTGLSIHEIESLKKLRKKRKLISKHCSKL